MKLLRVLAFSLMFCSSAYAVDHNNLDAGRPLSFDDAYAIAYGERALEGGFLLSRGKATFETEYLQGFAPNSHFTLGWEPQLNDNNFDAGEVSLSVFHNFNREHGNTPALAVRADVSTHLGDGEESGVNWRLRGIATKLVKNFGRLHLNLDGEWKSRAERRFTPGIILGFSKPLGYPTRFNRTGLLEIGWRRGEARGAESTILLGAGIRQQISPRAVFDVGIQSDIRGAEREKLRVVAGYATSF